MTRNFHRHVEPAVRSEPAQNGAAQGRERGLSRCAAIPHEFTLIAFLRSCLESFLETRRHPANRLVRRQLATCNAPALRSSGGEQRSAPDSSGQRFLLAIPQASLETRRATTPAWDRSNIFQSGAAAPGA